MLVLQFLRGKVIMLSIYIDDIHVQGKSFKECQDLVRQTTSLLQESKNDEIGCFEN